MSGLQENMNIFKTIVLENVPTSNEYDKFLAQILNHLIVSTSFTLATWSMQWNMSSIFIGQFFSLQ